MWETGEQTWQPLNMRGVKEQDNHGAWKNDPITVATYAEKHGLADAWRGHCKGIWNKIKTRKPSKAPFLQNRPIYMFGVHVPRNWHQARELDKENGNS